MNLNKKNTITILLAVILLGTFLRFYHLGSTSFVADEFLDINSSMAYAKTGHWQNWDFNFGKVNTDNIFGARDSRAWIYKWQVAEFLKLTSPNESNARFVSVIWGLISIILIYFVAKYFTGKKEIGLISAFLFSISIMGIEYDRKLRMYSMFFPVYLAFSWLFYRFLEENYKGKIKLCKIIYEKIGVNVVYLVPMLIFGIISILTHQLAANIAIAFIFYAIFRLYLSSKRGKLQFNKYLLGLSLVIVGLIAGFIIFADKMNLYTKELEFFGTHFGYFSKVLSDYSNFFVVIPLLFGGIYYLYRVQKLEKETLWLGTSFFAILLGAVFMWNRNVAEQYIFFITSFEIILISAGIYGFSDFLYKNLPQYKKFSFIIPLALSLLILPNYGYFFQDTNTYKQTSDSDSANYKKVFGYFMKARREGDVLITRNFRNFYWKGAKIKVFDFGGELNENKLSLDDIKKIQNENSTGWFILSDNDDIYISNDAIDYVAKNFTRVSNSDVRGKVLVYRWGI
jgi:hypothetical protein